MLFEYIFVFCFNSFIGFLGLSFFFFFLVFILFLVIALGIALDQSFKIASELLLRYPLIFVILILSSLSYIEMLLALTHNSLKGEK